MSSKINDKLQRVIELEKEGIFILSGESFSQFIEYVNKRRSMVEKKGDKVRVPLLKTLFNFAHFSIPVYYSNQHLPFWQGAAAWIDEENGLTEIQLRKPFKRGKLWGIYSHDEVIAHEVVHALRARLCSKKYEELIAYQTSKSLIRRYFGPFFRESWESYLFVSTAFFSLIHPLPFTLYFGYLLVRCSVYQSRLKKAVKHLIPKLKKTVKPLRFLIHLSDDEIDALSKDFEIFLRRLNITNDLRSQLLRHFIKPSVFV